MLWAGETVEGHEEYPVRFDVPMHWKPLVDDTVLRDTVHLSRSHRNMYNGVKWPSY